MNIFSVLFKRTQSRGYRTHRKTLIMRYAQADRIVERMAGRRIFSGEQFDKINKIRLKLRCKVMKLRFIERSGP